MSNNILIPITPDLLPSSETAIGKEITLINGDKLERIDFDQLAAEVGAEANDFEMLEINLQSESPTKKGFYFPTEAGIYANYGNIEVTTEQLEQLVLIVLYDGDTSFSLIEKSIPALGVVEEGNTQAVSGGEVYTAIVNSVNGVIEEGNTDAVSGGEVKSKFNEVFKDKFIESHAKDVGETATIYGAGFGIYGWGFPMKSRRNITKIGIKLKASNDISTEQRLIIRENNVNGAVLYDQLFSLEIKEDIEDIYLFDLGLVIENPNNTKLYCEFYSNTHIGIYRVNPAEVFTSALGYDQARYSDVNDLGATKAFKGGSYLDLYHEVYFTESKMIFNEESEQKIIDIAYENFQLPNDVNIATEITNDLFIKDFEDVGEFEIFSDGVGPQGSSYYGIGFPIGVLPICNKITFSLYYSDTKIRPVEVYCIVRDTYKDGDIVATSSTVQFPQSGGSGRYNLDFEFPVIINESGRLYAEIRSNGQFGVYRRTSNPPTIFTEANGYPPFAYTLQESGSLSNLTLYHDFYFITNVLEEKIQLTSQGEELFGQSTGGNTEHVFNLPNENLRFTLAGSSVTWGDGFLQSGYVNNLIYKMQSQVATSILPEVFDFGTILDNRKHYNSRALRLDGIGEEIEFELTGNEVSIVQSIERINVNASEIEIYINDVLYDTFNNFNTSEIGTETKTFTASGTSTYFDLGRAFTYGHAVTLNGNPLVVTHNIKKGVGFTIPVDSDCGIIRKIGTRNDGSINVNHFLWLKDTPSNGDEIVITYDYGEELFYEKTTIGSDSEGNNESPYGGGDISFDTTDPSSMGSGLDFRQTDDRAIKTYRFLENKTRRVKLKIKGNYNGSTGTPYFIFNFATNRFFHFQNAGIGGWSINGFSNNIAQEPTRGWQRVVEFNPNVLVYETTPNDDWNTRGHKIYKEQTLTLSQLRNLRTLPLREISYQSATDNYKVSKWQGIITDITETSVTFDGTIDTSIVKGDILIVGEYYSRNDEYFERFVDSVSGNTIHFNNPLNVNDVVFDKLSDFIGKGIVVRSYDLYTDKIQTMLENVQDSLPSAKIGLLENPMPNCLARELWGYPLILDKMSKDNQFVNSINYMSLREWQYSQSKTKVTLNTADKVFDEVLGKYYIPFGSNGQNLLSTDVKVGDVSIYGTKAVVQNGWAYVVNQTATGSSLNKPISYNTKAGQVIDKQPRVILFDDTITGDVTVEYSTTLWSGDSCHINTNSAELYAQFLIDFIL